jgi:hypothetical protein
MQRMSWKHSFQSISLKCLKESFSRHASTQTSYSAHTSHSRVLFPFYPHLFISQFIQLITKETGGHTMLNTPVPVQRT